MELKRVMVVMGTRPEAIKLCPLVRELRKRGKTEVSVLSTGQHRAMLDSAMEAFSVRADFDLDAMRTGQSSATLASRVLKHADEIFEAEKPEIVIVQGDTTSAYAAAASAFYRKIPVAHVEAGLRTYHMDAPFPEEYHRRAIALMSTYHFAPTVTAKKNLLREGIPERSVFITGNTVVDALRITLNEKKPAKPWHFPKNRRVILFTAHRKENLGANLAGMFCALRRIVRENTDVVAICPLHHNPEVRSAAKAILCGEKRIVMMEPPEIVSFHHLLPHCYLILTDSGGIQEEAVSLGIPTVVMRYSTERSEGMRAGSLRLCGSAEEGIVTVANRLLAKDCEEYASMKKPSAVFGDGRACARIADVLEKL